MMPTTFSSGGAVIATLVRTVVAAGSSATTLILTLPTILPTTFPSLSQELYHPQSVFVLHGMAGTTAAIKTGPVVDVLLQTAAISEALPGAEARRRQRSVGRGIRCVTRGLQAVATFVGSSTPARKACGSTVEKDHRTNVAHQKKHASSMLRTKREQAPSKTPLVDTRI